LPVVRHVVNSEQFEGVSSWLIGYAGQGCVMVATDPAERTVRLTFSYAIP
jgi:hypothetical protein